MGGIQSEAERQFYLSAFGVRLWYARGCLPGAAPTPQLDFSVAPRSAAGDASSIASMPVPPPEPDAPGAPESRPDLTRIMQDAAAEKGSGDGALVRQKEQPAAPVAETEKAAADDPASGARSVNALRALSINWGLWWSEEICLISSINDQASYDLQSQLATNILASLSGATKAADRLHWPVFHNPHVPADAPDRLAQILEKLGRKCARMHALIWLGVSAQAEGSAPIIRDFIGSPAVDFGHGLSALAADHHLKRALWQQLQQHELTGV